GGARGERRVVPRARAEGLRRGTPGGLDRRHREEERDDGPYAPPKRRQHPRGGAERGRRRRARRRGSDISERDDGGASSSSAAAEEGRPTPARDERLAGSAAVSPARVRRGKRTTATLTTAPSARTSGTRRAGA
ncbi:hypothetical protein THAOC_27216, partial [Thalassiosira oceanica]